MFTNFVLMKIDTQKLQTVQNYAHYIKRNRSRVYQMIKEGKLETVLIDGVTFIKTH